MQDEFKGVVDYEKFFKEMNTGCPVHKVQFNFVNTNAVLGMYLVTNPDVDSILEKRVNKSDINDDTLLVFESRHLTECCSIIYGAVKLIYQTDHNRDLTRSVIEELFDALHKPIFYNRFKMCIDDVIKKVGWKFEKGYPAYNLKIIIENIWFISYSDIDELTNDAIKEIKENSGGEEDE